MSHDPYEGGRNRLARHVAERAEALLTEGLNPTEVARVVGIHVNTARKIARGEHQGGSDKYERCPECGGLVIMPCILCAVHEAK